MHLRCDPCRRPDQKSCVECGKPTQSRFRTRCVDCLTRPCKHCGLVFTTTNWAYKFCGERCRRAHYRQVPVNRPREARPPTPRDEINRRERERYAVRMQDPEWAQARRERAAIARHGLSLSAIDHLVDMQGGCAICAASTAGTKSWHVDHDHACCPTGKACEKCRRGILCHRCNSALGCFGDDASVIERARILVASFHPIAPVVRAGPTKHSLVNRTGFAASHHLSYAYKWTLAEVLALFERQDSACAVCLRTSSSGMAWNVDHARTCCPGDKSCGGCVRAVLCHLCNKAMGLFRDDPELLRAASAYLIRWTSR